MTIEIDRPEIEAIIQERLHSGAYADVQDVILRALQDSLVAQKTPGQLPKKTIEELFAPLAGLDIEFTRNPSTGRPVDL